SADRVLIFNIFDFLGGGSGGGKGVIAPSRHRRVAFSLQRPIRPFPLPTRCSVSIPRTAVLGKILKIETWSGDRNSSPTPSTRLRQGETIDQKAFHAHDALMLLSAPQGWPYSLARSSSPRAATIRPRCLRVHRSRTIQRRRSLHCFRAPWTPPRTHGAQRAVL